MFFFSFFLACVLFQLGQNYVGVKNLKKEKKKKGVGSGLANHPGAFYFFL
jgi:hypothetical protein